MNSNLKTQLRDALKLTNPEIAKDYLYDRCVNKYVDAMLPAISRSISLNYSSAQLQPDQFSFSQTQIREQIGTIGKKQDYIYQLMKSNESTSLLVVVMKGFGKDGLSKLSTVRLNPIYRDLVMEELLNLKVVANQVLMDDIERNANYFVNVDPASLKSFIAKTKDTLRTTTNGSAYTDKLRRNLAAAKQLQSMIHNPDATHPTPYINERWEVADCGRIYGQGYSLQRMPKEVRHAALGFCHKYDFKACAFAIMAGLAQEIDSNLRLGATLDYIKNRQLIRKRIAAQLNIEESLVKTIFTAMGFGAVLKNNQHNAIRRALAEAARQQLNADARLDRDTYNNLGEDEYQRLIANQTFRFIYEELQEVNKTILDYFSDNELVIDNATYSLIDPKTGKTRTPRQKLAWIYQALESKAMQQFCDLAQQEPLLTTHDCIYFKDKLPSSVVLDVTVQLQATFPYLRFEHEAIRPIAEDSYFAQLSSEAEQFELEHKQRMAEEEIAAQGYLLAKACALSSATAAHSAFFPAP